MKYPTVETSAKPAPGMDNTTLTASSTNSATTIAASQQAPSVATAPSAPLAGIKVEEKSPTNVVWDMLSKSLFDPASGKANWKGIGITAALAGGAALLSSFFGLGALGTIIGVIAGAVGGVALMNSDIMTGGVKKPNSTFINGSGVTRELELKSVHIVKDGKEAEVNLPIIADEFRIQTTDQIINQRAQRDQQAIVSNNAEMTAEAQKMGTPVRNILAAAEDASKNMQKLEGFVEPGVIAKIKQYNQKLDGQRQEFLKEGYSPFPPAEVTPANTLTIETVLKNYAAQKGTVVTNLANVPMHELIDTAEVALNHAIKEKYTDSANNDRAGWTWANGALTIASAGWEHNRVGANTIRDDALPAFKASNAQGYEALKQTVLPGNAYSLRGYAESNSTYIHQNVKTAAGNMVALNDLVHLRERLYEFKKARAKEAVAVLDECHQVSCKLLAATVTPSVTNPEVSPANPVAPTSGIPTVPANQPPAPAPTR